jgi:hypothetical protein
LFAFYTILCIAAVAYYTFSQSYVIAVEFLGCGLIIVIEIMQLLIAAISAVEFRTIETAA